MGGVWSSGAVSTSRHGHGAGNPLLHDEDPLAVMGRSEHPHLDAPSWVFILAFSLRRSNAENIDPCTLSAEYMNQTWGTAMLNA